LAAELRAVADIISQMLDHAHLTIESYRNKMRREPFERIAVRRILTEICKNPKKEDILRNRITELSDFTKIEGGLLKIDDHESQDKWKETQLRAKSYLLNLKEPIKTLSDCRVHLENNIKNFPVDPDDINQ